MKTFNCFQCEEQTIAHKCFSCLIDVPVLHMLSFCTNYNLCTLYNSTLTHTNNIVFSQIKCIVGFFFFCKKLQMKTPDTVNYFSIDSLDSISSQYVNFVFNL